MSNGHSGLVGYALDGFGLYDMTGAGGAAITNADLDECHGHVGQVVWDGEVRTMYHYHLTAEYPYTIGCFRGTPVRAGGGQRPPATGLSSMLRPPSPPGQRPLFPRP